MSFLKDFKNKISQKVPPVVTKHFYTITLYTGGVNVSNWKELSTEEKEIALSKPWKIRWWYRSPVTGNLERQKDIKAGVNRLKTMTERMSFLRNYVKAMKETLDEGYNPYTYAEYETNHETIPAETALLEALAYKEKLVSPTTYAGYKKYTLQFIDYLKVDDRHRHDIKLISRKVVTEFLDHVLKNNSPRTRNNARGDLSAIFGVLSDRFIINSNFIKNDIPKLKVTAKADRRFKTHELEKISEYLKEYDPYFLTFLKIMAYNFMRPVEVCRLKVEDIDLDLKEVYFDQKTKKGKIKRIPQILIPELRKLITGNEPNFFLFTPFGKPSLWPVKDNDKRNYWSKRFKKVKDKLDIETDMYGLRHYFITDLYQYFRKEMKLSKDASIEAVTDITGHESKDGVMNYIHAHDIEKPEDWSDKINFKL